MRTGKLHNNNTYCTQSVCMCDSSTVIPLLLKAKAHHLWVLKNYFSLLLIDRFTCVFNSNVDRTLEASLRLMWHIFLYCSIDSLKKQGMLLLCWKKFSLSAGRDYFYFNLLDPDVLICYKSINVFWFFVEVPLKSGKCMSFNFTSLW